MLSEALNSDYYILYLRLEAFKIRNLMDKSSSNAVGKTDLTNEEIMLDTLAWYKEPGLKELTPTGHVDDRVTGRVGDGGPGCY